LYGSANPVRAGDSVVLLSEAMSAAQLADASLRDRAIVQSGPPIALRYYIDQYWVDDQSVFLRGYLFVPSERISAFCHIDNDVPVEISRFARPDLAAVYGEAADVDQAGFSAVLPFRAGAPITLEITTALGVTRLALVMAGRSKVSRTYETDSAYLRLVLEANRPGARILEIGSRVVGAISKPRVVNFPLAAQFVGVDIHPGRGVDVVCDAHSLSSVFRPGSFDYVFSLSVLEHLPAPWQIAAEINRVLAVGGQVMKSVPFAFPLHETPNDFWRFSDKGLEQLFGPDFGYEVLSSGMSCEVRIIPEWRDVLAELPLNPGFGEAWIFSRKVAECPATLAFGTTAARSLSYPSHVDDAEQRAREHASANLPFHGPQNTE
jgi:SAM-dependent methyltransferase